MVDVAAEIRTGHQRNTTRELNRVERLKTAQRTSVSGSRLEPGTSPKRGRNYTLSAAKFCVSIYSQIEKILPLLEMNSASPVHSQRLYKLFQ
jgi:hypothetical protein